MATRSGVTVTITIEGDSLSSGAGVNGAAVSLYQVFRASWAQGTSAGEVDKVFQDDVATAVTPVDLDLAGGTNVKDPASQADQTFTKLTAVIIENRDATDNIVVGGDANSVPIFDAAADSITLLPGEIFVWTAATGTDGVAVTASTGDILQLTASANTPTARVTLIGR